MSVRWRPSCRTHIRSLSSKSCIALRTVSAFSGWFALHDRSGSSKYFNPSQCSVSIWNCTSTLNIELPTEKTSDSNYGITVSKKKTAGRQTHDALRSNAPWLLKLHCLSCPPAHAQHHQPHTCRVLAIWKTCVSSAPPCIRFLQLDWHPVAVVQYGTHLHTNNTQNNTMKQNIQNGTYTKIRIRNLQNWTDAYKTKSYIHTLIQNRTKRIWKNVTNETAI